MSTTAWCRCSVFACACWCWWVCFIRTILILCSIAYFLAFWTRLASSDVNLGRDVPKRDPVSRLPKKNQERSLLQNSAVCSFWYNNFHLPVGKLKTLFYFSELLGLLIVLRSFKICIYSQAWFFFTFFSLNSSKFKLEFFLNSSFSPKLKQF